MRRFVVPAVVAVGLLALPESAAATHSGSDCTYAQTPNNAGDTVVYVPLPTRGDAAVYDHNTDDQAGTTNEADQATGACVNTAVGPFEGGTAECGAGVNGTGGKGEYCVLDGDNQNVFPLDGYVGVSNYEGNDPNDTRSAVRRPARTPTIPRTTAPTRANAWGSGTCRRHTATGSPATARTRSAVARAATTGTTPSATDAPRSGNHDPR